MQGQGAVASFTLSLICFILLFAMNKADTCSQLSCDYYCCGDYCCSYNDDNYSYGYSFYNLWYFWFLIIVIMMTCCGACSYIKRRQYYMRQQQALNATVVQHPGTVHAPPTTYGANHTNNMGGPPMGVIPGPPPYSEVTSKPDQFPQANYGYPNYGFTSPIYPASMPGSAPYPGTVPAPAPENTNTSQPPVTDTPAATPYPPLPATPYPPSADCPPATTPYPTAAPPDTSAEPAHLPTNPPPYTPTPSDNVTNNVPVSDQTNP